MKQLTITTTSKREVIDITDEVAKAIRHAHPEIRSGICQLSVLHTTAALTCADLDPGTDLDLLDAFEAMVPKLQYRHPHDPSHVRDHILSALIGTNITIPINDGVLVLGTWQRIVLMEFDGPRERRVTLTIISHA